MGGRSRPPSRAEDISAGAGREFRPLGMTPLLWNLDYFLVPICRLHALFSPLPLTRARLKKPAMSFSLRVCSAFSILSLSGLPGCQSLDGSSEVPLPSWCLCLFRAATPVSFLSFELVFLSLPAATYSPCPSLSRCRF